MKEKDSMLFCKPDWSIVCSSEGCFCEFRQRDQVPQQPLACTPPAQIQCHGTTCICIEVKAPQVFAPVGPGAPDCGVIAALAAASIYKALLLCR